MIDSSAPIHIPADDILIGRNIKNIRSVFSEQATRELADDIYENGLIHNPTVMEIEDDDGDISYELVAGERRLRAIQLIQSDRDDTFMEDGVPCTLFVGTVEDGSFVNATENLSREDVDDVDTSRWVAMQVDNGLTQSTLAKKLSKSLQWVNFRDLFHRRACDELKEALREGLLSFTAAYQLSKNVDHDEQKKRIQRARSFNEKITVEEATNAGDPDRTSRPSAKKREHMLAKSETIREKTGSEISLGVSTALRWVDGLITDEEMEKTLQWEAEKQILV